VTIYRLVEKNGRDHERGGYFEACTREWKRDTDRRTTVMEPEGAKSQNTHIHILEAYTNLLRAWPDAGLKQAHRELMDVLLQKILDPKTHHLILFLGEDWKPKTRTISYGHDIEFSWLITEAAEVQGDEELLKTVKKAALEIAAVTLAEGVQKDGSLIYESDPNGKVNTDREWWPQAEAAVGFYNAYQISGDKRYRDEAQKVWGYIEENLVDHKNGEWFRARTSQGKVVPTPKVSMWKCPYHNGRSCLELLARLDAR
jgi:mannobiose 2-epimerase